ncbi:unnamed protein product [Discosporangium mesarthrocarpum]
MKVFLLLFGSLTPLVTSVAEARASAWVGGARNVPASILSVNKALGLRGGSEDEREWKFHEVVPLVSAVPCGLFGLDLLFNPDGITRFFDDDRQATPSERSMAMYIGANNLLVACTAATLGSKGGIDNSKIANGLLLGIAAVEEAIMQIQTSRQTEKTGFQALDPKWKTIMTGLRVVIGCLSAVALYKVFDEEDDS